MIDCINLFYIFGFVWEVVSYIMKVSFQDLVIFCTSFFVLRGIWQICTNIILKRGYKLFKNEGESFLQYCKRDCPTFDAKFFKRNLAFRVYLVVRVVLNFLVALLFIGIYFYFNEKGYGEVLKIRF